MVPTHCIVHKYIQLLHTVYACGANRSSSTSSVDKGHVSSARSIKKSFYSKLKKEEEEREAEWAEKYRDRVEKPCTCVYYN